MRTEHYLFHVHVLGFASKSSAKVCTQRRLFLSSQLVARYDVQGSDFEVFLTLLL